MLKSWMFKSFRFSLFEWALAATAFYCGAVFSGVHENWITFLGLSPNEVGDFLAGVFGPLAFLWLVFGYYQQGEELKHSVEALKLQAEELRNSVEQQKELVEVSREAIQLETSEKERQEKRRKVEITPKLTVVYQPLSLNSHEVLIRNSGGECLDLEVTLHCNEEYVTSIQLGLLSKGSQKAVATIRIFDTEKHTITFKYRDIDGNHYEDSQRLKLF